MKKKKKKSTSALLRAKLATSPRFSPQKKLPLIFFFSSFAPQIICFSILCLKSQMLVLPLSFVVQNVYICYAVNITLCILFHYYFKIIFSLGKKIKCYKDISTKSVYQINIVICMIALPNKGKITLRHF